jgi:hypothetical protein
MTVLVMLLALLGAQAASTVCNAQCAQHEAMHKPGPGGAMGHCGDAAHEGAHCAGFQTCPELAHGVCAVDLLSGTQSRTMLAPPAQAVLRLDAMAPPAVTTFASRPFVPLRSSYGDPPQLTHLRI